MLKKNKIMKSVDSPSIEDVYLFLSQSYFTSPVVNPPLLMLNVQTIRHICCHDEKTLKWPYSEADNNLVKTGVVKKDMPF